MQTVSAADMGKTKLLVQRNDLSVKIEVNTVIRGAVHPTRTMPLTAAASDALMVDLELPLLSPEDIAEINRHLEQVPEIMAHFGYEYIRG